MCGVFGYVGRQNEAAEIVLEGLKELEYRGYDSWGVAVLGKDTVPALPNAIAIKKRVGKIGDETVQELPEGSLSIGHTRWATHGGATQQNAHPHQDCTKKIAVIHNGIIENYDSLRQELTKQGHIFVSQTDTEVIAHLIESFCMKMPFQDAFLKTFSLLEGLNAVVAIHRDENTILTARKGSPLVIGFGSHEHFIASDPSALLPHTKKVYFLEDDQMAIIQEDGVEILSTQTGEAVTFTPQTLEWDVTLADKGSYEHYMLKEIHEQPRVISSVIAGKLQENVMILDTLRTAQNITFLGCGTASYAALIGKYFFALIAGIPSQTIVGSEFAYQEPFIGPGSVVFALSQSGETIDILEPAQTAQKNGAKVLALVNVLGSSLFRMADSKLLIGAGPEKAVASTKAFTAKVAHLFLLAYALRGEIEEGRHLLEKAILSMQKVLEKENIEHIQSLAQKISSHEHIFVIGRGISFPASLETALKIKEISYIHAEGFAAGELKHGPLALIEKGTPCIVLLPQDDTYSATLTAAMELQARGAFVIGISPTRADVLDYHLSFDDVGLASVLPITVTAQLLAYYLTLQKGLDPDKPRNLAKSVTVK